jgi:hypothetical protein
MSIGSSMTNEVIAMRINKGPTGDITMTLSDDERYLIKQCLNECCHGFRIQDFKRKIGADKAVVSQYLDQLGAAKVSPKATAGGLHIAEAGDGVDVTLTPDQARIFLNCMSETEKELGPSEFPSRFGASLDEVKGLFAAIDAKLT